MATVVTGDHLAVIIPILNCRNPYVTGHHSDRSALCNLPLDHAEATDLSTSEPERVRKLAAEMRRLYQSVNGREP